jgi:hypothetical protein
MPSRQLRHATTTTTTLETRQLSGVSNDGHNEDTCTALANGDEPDKKYPSRDDAISVPSWEALVTSGRYLYRHFRLRARKQGLGMVPAVRRPRIGDKRFRFCQILHISLGSGPLSSAKFITVDVNGFLSSDARDGADRKAMLRRDGHVHTISDAST